MKLAIQRATVRLRCSTILLTKFVSSLPLLGHALILCDYRKSRSYFSEFRSPRDRHTHRRRQLCARAPLLRLAVEGAADFVRLGAGRQRIPLLSIPSEGFGGLPPESLWRKSGFERAQLQSCRIASGLNGASTSERWLLSDYDFSHRLLRTYSYSANFVAPRSIAAVVQVF
jgi:hypothetical protein